MSTWPSGKFGAILADPPWRFECWSETGDAAHGVPPYERMTFDEIAALPVESVAASDSVLFMWICWPSLPDALRIISDWGFEYKTCGFCWVKGDDRQADFFRDEFTAYMGLGYWTRANSEVCLLATRGKPKRLNADVRQAIIAPRRQHSRKPDGIHERIERLVVGPYLELFARQRRPNWVCWGNEVDKFKPYDAQDDFAKSLEVGYDHIRDRVANGGKRGFMDEPS